MTAPLAAQPLLTHREAQKLASARIQQQDHITLSLNLGKSDAIIHPGVDSWSWESHSYPYPPELKERTVYHWDGTSYAPVARFSGSLIKLVPTDWGPPTFEIDGIKMLPTSRISPFEDARLKVAMIAPRGKRVLDCCAGLGYFAHWCLDDMAAEVHSFEKNDSVLWLRTINPWSPPESPRLRLQHGDIALQISTLPASSYDAILHDPPRFGIAGELYSQAFYDELARVIKPGGRLFHYTGTPNKLTSGRNVPGEVQQRLRKAGFNARIEGDGILAQASGQTARR